MNSQAETSPKAIDFPLPTYHSPNIEHMTASLVKVVANKVHVGNMFHRLDCASRSNKSLSFTTIVPRIGTLDSLIGRLCLSSRIEMSQNQPQDAVHEYHAEV